MNVQIAESAQVDDRRGEQMPPDTTEMHLRFIAFNM